MKTPPLPRRMLKALTLFLLFIPGVVGQTFYVDDFGAAPNQPGVDSTAAISQTITQAISYGPGAEVVFSSGRYYIAPTDQFQVCFLLNNASGLTISGQGSHGPAATTLVLTEPRGGGFQFMGGSNITIRDLAYDHDPPPFTQGVVTGRNRDQNWIDIAVEAGFPLPNGDWYTGTMDYPYSRWGMVFHPTQRIMKPSAPDFIFTSETVENRGGGVFRIRTTDDIEKFKIDSISVGDRFVLIIRPIMPGAFLFYQVANGTLDNVEIRATPSIVFTSMACNRSVIRNSTVGIETGSPRLISANADGWHFQQDRVGPLVENTFLEGMADDGIAINCYQNKLHSVLNTRQLIVDSTTFIETGDQIQIYNPRDGVMVLESVVNAVDQLFPPPDGVTTLVAYRVTLSDDIPALTIQADPRTSDQFFNVSYSGAGYQIKNNHFETHRGRPIFVQSPHGLIEDNWIVNSQGFGIVVTNEPSWPLGPVPFDVTIRNNTLLCPVQNEYWYANTPLAAGIQVRGSKGLANDVATTPVVHDVTLENNVVINPPATAVYLGAVRDVRMVGTSVFADGGRVPPKTDDAIVIDQATGVKLKNTSVVDSDTLSLIRHGLRIESNVATGCEGVALENYQATVGTGGQAIYDLRTPAGPTNCPGSIPFPVLLTLPQPLPPEGWPVGTALTLSVTFPEGDLVSSLEVGDVLCQSCQVSSVQPSAGGYLLTVVAEQPGVARIRIPAGALSNNQNNLNLVSNQVEVVVRAVSSSFTFY